MTVSGGRQYFQAATQLNDVVPFSPFLKTALSTFQLCPAAPELPESSAQFCFYMRFSRTITHSPHHRMR